MTEKRFIIKPSIIIDDATVIIDNQKEYTFPILNSALNYIFCKVLNEQHEEIKELQRHVDVMRSGALTDDKRIKELYEENKRLKQQINTIIDELQAEKETAISKNERIRLDFAITVLKELKGD